MEKNVKNKFDKFFLLDWKKVFLIVIIWIIAVILHNMIYALGIYFGGENFWGNGDEALFFIVAIIVIPIYFVISVAYTLAKKFRKK